MIKFRVKQEPPHIDDALLVAKVKQHQFLFDVKDSDYRNLPQRAEVWKNIAGELNIDNRKRSSAVNLIPKYISIFCLF